MDVQTIKNKVISLLKDIIDSVELQECQLEKRYKMLSSYVHSDAVEALLLEFHVYTDNLSQENRSQEILYHLLNEIFEQEKKYQVLLDGYTLIEYPEWASTLEILKEENCIVNYIQDSFYCFNEEADRNNYINSLTGKALKEELVGYVNKETQNKYFKFYDDFSESDYDKAIEFVKIDMNNDKIYELNYDIDELKRFKTLFNLFNYTNVRNIYASALIDIITAISEPINNIISIKYPHSYIQSNKITRNLISLHKKYPDCFFIDGLDKYVDIMEPIERRNMYIHNLGVANSKYLEFGKVIQDNNWNLKGAKNGEFLKIDSYYFQETYELIKNFISHI